MRPQLTWHCCAGRGRDDAGTTFHFRIFRRRGGGTGVTSREGGGDSGHVYESLVLAGLALLNYNKRAMG